MACNEATKDELAPATPNTGVSAISDIPTGTQVVKLRNDDCPEDICDCTCCCDLIMLQPLNQLMSIQICGADIGCDAEQCQFGGAPCAAQTNGVGGIVMLFNDGTVTSNFHKIFCSGEVGDDFEITNLDMTYTARFRIECGGDTSNVFALTPGQHAYITKSNLDCDIDPLSPCIW